MATNEVDWTKATPQQVDDHINSFRSKGQVDWAKLPEETKSNLSFNAAFQARKEIGTSNQELQDEYSYHEHFAFARETARDNPANALVAPLMVPAYTAMKFAKQALVDAGLKEGTGHRSNASVDQIGAGMRGTMQGLSDAVKPWLMYAKEAVEKPWELYKKEIKSKTVQMGSKDTTETLESKPWEMSWKGVEESKSKIASIPKSSFSRGQSSDQILSNIKQTIKDVFDAAPITGELSAVYETGKNLEKEKYKDALFSALGFIPGLGGIIKSKPYFHGTRKAFDKHEEGLIFLTEQPYTAGTYASGAGGRRGGAKAAFFTDTETGAIYEQKGEELIQVVGKEKGRKLPADEEELADMGIYPSESWDKTAQGENIRRYYVDSSKTLDLFHKGYDRAGKPINEGATVLAQLDHKGNRWAQEVVEKAKKGDFDWSTTKYPEAQKAWKEILIPQLEKKGYDAIEYWDDMHPTLAVFSNKQLMSTLPKTLKTQNKQNQQESIKNLIKFLEERGSVEEAKKLRGMLDA